MTRASSQWVYVFLFWYNDVLKISPHKTVVPDKSSTKAVVWVSLTRIVARFADMSI